MFLISFFGFLHRLSFKKCHLWVIIVVFLYVPSFVHSQPSGHFDPSSLSPIQKGEFLLAQSLNDEALRLYEFLIDEGRGDGYAFRGMVRAYKNMNKLKDAEVWIENFLVDNLDSSPALYASGYVNYLKKDMEKAEYFFYRALEFNANNALALNNLGTILLCKESYNQAAEKVREAIRINPKEPIFFYNLEAIYKKMGDPGLIIADYNFYLEHGAPDLVRGYGMAVGRYMRQAGFKLYNAGRLDEAIRKFMEIETVFKRIKHQRGLVPIYFSLGLLYEEKGDFESAKKYFVQVLTLSSLHIQAKERLKRLQ